jgi:hypothetical protein
MARVPAIAGVLGFIVPLLEIIALAEENPVLARIVGPNLRMLCVTSVRMPDNNSFARTFSFKQAPGLANAALGEIPITEIGTRKVRVVAGNGPPNTSSSVITDKVRTLLLRRLKPWDFKRGFGVRNISMVA